MIVAAADSSFKATRPDLLMPSMLGPFTRVAKVVEGDPKTAVLVLGHADSAGAMASNTRPEPGSCQVGRGDLPHERFAK